jgi:hypothetical protein
MSELDCMDNSCRYAKSKTGQRTNGGCRCLQGLGQEQRIKVHSFIADLQRQIAEAQDEIEWFKRECIRLEKYEGMSITTEQEMVDSLQIENNKLHKEIEWLKQGLHNYGRHLFGCSVFINGQDIACDCGFTRSQLVGENS